MFVWRDRGPLTRDVLDAVVAAVQERLDLLAVLRERYGMQVDDAGERWRCACFLPSTVPGFAGTCAEQDTVENNGEQPRNLWISEGHVTRVWRCHSCKRHGDVIDLIEYADALPRGNQAISLRAVRVAAQLAGVAYLMDGREPGPDDEPDDALVAVFTNTPPKPRNETPTVDFDRARLRNYLAAQHWHELLHSEAGANARHELQRRGVTEQQVVAYQLGYALNQWRDLLARIPQAHHADAVALGLLERNKRRGNVYDRQRDRIVLPYCEPARGNRPPAITGFAGRDLSNSPQAPKWINSNNMPGVWEKSSALFGLYQAQERARQSKRVALTEGGFDTLAFDRAECPAVALVSTALTHAHCEVMVDVLGIEALTIAFDGDHAGRRETIVAATTALTFGLPYAAVTLIDPGEGNDPDDLAADDLRERWEAPLSIVEFALRFGDHATAAHRLALLAALPDEPANQLRAAWDIERDAIVKHRDRGSTPAQDLARLLTERPELAQHIARAELDDVLATEPALRRRLAALDCGEVTDVLALPRDLRRAWLLCQVQREQSKLVEHERSDPFAAGNSHDAFRVWFERGNALRSSISRKQKMIADQ